MTDALHEFVAFCICFHQFLCYTSGMRVTTSFGRFREVLKKGPRAIVLYVISQVVFTVVLVIAIFFLVKGIFRASEPYKHSIAVIEANQQIMEQIGENYRQKGFILGSFQNSGKKGGADFSYKVIGKSGISKVQVVAAKADGIWSYSVLDFYPDARGDDVINLLE